MSEPNRGIVHRIIAPDYPGAFLDWRAGSGQTVEVFDIFVPNECRRVGVGRAMLNTLLDSLPQGTKLVWLITRAENKIAHEFYYEMRFRVVAPLFDFYRDDGAKVGTIDALMFGRDIEVRT